MSAVALVSTATVSMPMILMNWVGLGRPTVTSTPCVVAGDRAAVHDLAEGGLIVARHRRRRNVLRLPRAGGGAAVFDHACPDRRVDVGTGPTAIDVVIGDDFRPARLARSPMFCASRRTMKLRPVSMTRPDGQQKDDEATGHDDQDLTTGVVGAAH